MSKLKLLVFQLYKQKVTSKSFILMTLLYLIIIAGIVNWSSIKEVFTSEDAQVKIALIDKTGTELASQFPSDKQLKFDAVALSEKAADKKVLDGEYDAALYLYDNKDQLAAKLATSTSLDLTIQSAINSLAENAGKVYSVQKLNLSAEQAKKIINMTTSVTQVDLTQNASSKTADEKSAGILIAYIVGFFIYLFVTSYLSMITTDIASEKGSRVLEVLMASIKPSTHLISKLIGVFLTGMTQFVLLIVGGIIIIKLSVTSSKLDGISTILKDITPSYIFFVLCFFILSVMLFLIIGALAGSLVSKVEEASQVMMPGILLSLVGFYVLISGISNPDTMLIKVCSYIPFTSGMVMTLRLGATDIGTLQVIIALALLIATVVLLFMLSLSFYKRSVLTYSSGGLIQKIKTVLKVTT
ncbi:ABC transporter permease [Kurthia sibirica]|uniref:ABC transporter permease n=1 Tax=Kurthia sibirica TaxID=202750 RepID=UPI0011713D26|nr:ABC transporter permease [Kurthia sibirica]GEK33347.1 sodium ABC transporter permease [Kurthia sibirica]